MLPTSAIAFTTLSLSVLATIASNHCAARPHMDTLDPLGQSKFRRADSCPSPSIVLTEEYSTFCHKRYKYTWTTKQNLPINYSKTIPVAQYAEGDITFPYSSKLSFDHVSLSNLLPPTHLGDFVPTLWVQVESSNHRPLQSDYNWEADQRIRNTIRDKGQKKLPSTPSILQLREEFNFLYERNQTRKVQDWILAEADRWELIVRRQDVELKSVISLMRQDANIARVAMAFRLFSKMARMVTDLDEIADKAQARREKSANQIAKADKGTVVWLRREELCRKSGCIWIEVGLTEKEMSAIGKDVEAILSDFGTLFQSLPRKDGAGVLPRGILCGTECGFVYDKDFVEAVPKDGSKFCPSQETCNWKNGESMVGVEEQESRLVAERDAGEDKLMQGVTKGFLKAVGSEGLEWIPLVAPAKHGWEAYYGRDLVTGERISRLESFVEGVLSLPPPVVAKSAKYTLKAARYGQRQLPTWLKVGRKFGIGRWMAHAKNMQGHCKKHCKYIPNVDTPRQYERWIKSYVRSPPKGMRYKRRYVGEGKNVVQDGYYAFDSKKGVLLAFGADGYPITAFPMKRTRTKAWKKWREISVRPKKGGQPGKSSMGQVNQPRLKDRRWP